MELDPISIKPFFKAYKIKCKEQVTMMNIDAWYHGLYNQYSIASCLSKNTKYPKQPIDFSPTEALSIDEKLKIWAINVGNEFDRKEKELSEIPMVTEPQ